MNQALLQFTRFLAGGASTTLLNWSLVWFLVEMIHLHYLVSINLAVCAVYAYSYLINKMFVFENTDQNHGMLISKFVTLQLALVVTSNIVIFLSVSIAGMHYMLVLIVVSVVNAIANFLVMKMKIFNTNEVVRLDDDQSR